MEINNNRSCDEEDEGIHDDDDGLKSCFVCGYENNNQKKLYNHIHTHKLKHCEKCQKYIGLSTFYSHKKVCGGVGEKSWKCHLCKYSSVFKFDLDRHLKIHKENSCNHCGRSFNCPEKLSDHMRIHTGRDFNCDICPAKFSSLSSMNRHKRDQHFNAKIDFTAGFIVFDGEVTKKKKSSKT